MLHVDQLVLGTEVVAAVADAGWDAQQRAVVPPPEHVRDDRTGPLSVEVVGRGHHRVERAERLGGLDPMNEKQLAMGDRDERSSRGDLTGEAREVEDPAGDKEALASEGRDAIAEVLLAHRLPVVDLRDRQLPELLHRFAGRGHLLGLEV